MFAQLLLKTRSVTRATILIASAAAVAVIFAMLADTASARFLNYGGTTSQSGGRTQLSVVARVHRHKTTLSLAGFSVSASYRCTDGTITPVQPSPVTISGPISRRGYFSGSVPVNGGTHSLTGQIAPKLRSVSGTFQANYTDPAHGTCDSGPLTWTVFPGG